MVVPAKAGTHTAESINKPPLADDPLQHGPVVMGPGSARSLSSGAHSRDPLAWPGRPAVITPQRPGLRAVRPGARSSAHRPVLLGFRLRSLAAACRASD